MVLAEKIMLKLDVKLDWKMYYLMFVPNGRLGILVMSQSSPNRIKIFGLSWFIEMSPIHAHNVR